MCSTVHFSLSTLAFDLGFQDEVMATIVLKKNSAFLSSTEFRIFSKHALKCI